MSSLNEILIREHDLLVVNRDSRSGLCALIAIHDTTLGPSLGGLRMKSYSSVDEAASDVLKLSEAMTYKNSLCGIRFGGGKSVILANTITGDITSPDVRAGVFRQFGKWVNTLGGRYITAEDVGTSVTDMSYVLEETQFVAGRDPSSRGGGGDPSPYTALGVFEGTKACLERAYNSQEFRGRRFAVQGVGHVGRLLVKLLCEAGGSVVVADVSSDNLRKTVEEFGVEAVSPDEITGVDCDVFAPCALGGVISTSVAASLRCKIVAGAANNQVGEVAAEKILMERGILYAPDFAINAGGVILCASEFEPGGFSEAWVRSMVMPIYKTVGRILDESSRTGELPGNVAVRLAKERIINERRQRANPPRGS